MKQSTHDATVVAEFPSPAGALLLADRDGKLALCDWTNSPHFEAHRRALGPTVTGTTTLLERAAQQLREYFDGTRMEFDLPLADAQTPFMTRVREGLLGMRYGDRTTYKTLAKRIGTPTAVRAVARAVALNPFSIIVPCHRVVGSDGRLTGYAGGLKAKELLLSLESR